MNGLRAVSIVTLEQPVEYVLRPRKASIVQRDVGNDTRHMAHGINHALRLDADVVAADSLQSADAVEAAVLAAEAGHLVVGVVTAPDATRAIHRLLSPLTGEALLAMRARLADVLQVVVVQRMVPSTQPQRRMVACEILRVTPKISETIRDGARMRELPRLLRESEAEGSGSTSLEASLNALVRARMMDPDIAAAITGPAAMTTEP